MPRSSGTIVPNGKGPGGGITINVDARGAQEGVAEQLSKLLPGVVSSAISGSVKAVERGFPAMAANHRKRWG